MWCPVRIEEYDIISFPQIEHVTVLTDRYRDGCFRSGLLG
jgi:hypothetical protein